ncbi:DegV family protein [Alkaliphilus crotonatoxidans]
MNTIILTDSCCDLTPDFVEANVDYIDIIGMPVEIDGFQYFDDFGKTLSHNDFYRTLRNGVIPSTSQINVFRFVEKFKSLYNEGKAILYLGFTSGMSGTFNNAVLAKDQFLEDCPGGEITIVDTASASIGQGVLIVKAVEMLREGKTAQEIAAWVESNKMNTNHWFAVDDLHYLKKGGRISAVTATLGTALNVKPILTVDTEGKLKTYTNVRGRKKSIKFLFERFLEHMKEETDTIIIGHGNAPEEAETLRSYVLQECKPRQLIVSELSATIASHVGPNMLAIAFLGAGREEK